MKDFFMSINIKDKIKEISIENLALLLIMPLSWLGFGEFMAGLILIAFIFSLISKYKRDLILNDKVLIIILSVFVINNVISSLLSVDKLPSTLLSAFWFIVILIPTSYVRFSLNKKNEFLIKKIVPLSIFIAIIIVLYLLGSFFHSLVKHETLFPPQRYRFIFLGFQGTPYMLTILGGIGYGWLRQKKEKKFLWIGFLYLIICSLGVALSGDRGGIVGFFIMVLILLSFDYKKLIIFLALCIMIGFISLRKLDFFIRFRYIIEIFYSKSARNYLVNTGHIATFKAAWEMIKDNWIMGVGTNNFSKFSKLYGNHTWNAFAHNFVLQLWAENGLFGMLSGLSIIGLIIYRWLKYLNLYKYKYIAIGVGASFIGLLIFDLTNNAIWILGLALPFWLLAGVMGAIYFIVKEQAKEPQPAEINKGL